MAGGALFGACGAAELEVVEWDSLEMATSLALMSAQWELPVPQNILFSGETGVNASQLFDVGCQDEKVRVAKEIAKDFRLLVTPNDIEWTDHKQVTKFPELVEVVWGEGVKLGRHHPFLTCGTYFGVMRKHLEEEGKPVGKFVPVVVTIGDASKPPLVTGFDPRTKEDVQKAILRAPASVGVPLGIPPGKASVSVNGPRGQVFETPHCSGLMLAMLTALSENVMLRNRIGMLLEFDAMGRVRNKVQDPAFHAGIKDMLAENSHIKTLLVDMATYDCADEFIPEDSDVQAVGVPSMAAFKEQIKTNPRLGQEMLRKEEDESTGGGEESGTHGGEGEGETSQGGRSEGREEGGREGGRSEGREEEEMTTSDSVEVCLTRLISKHLTVFLEIQEELGGSVPTRIITPHRSGPRSTDSLAFMLLSLFDLKTAGKRPNDSFLQQASDLLSGTFDGGLPAGKTVKGVSAGLEKIVGEVVGLVQGRGLSVEEGEGNMWTALNHLSMVLPEEIGRFASFTKRGTPRVKDSVPDVLRVNGSATS